ncbi:DNA cytosine methyltransferase [Gluconacetobacter entanii]|uniref:DNA (cytosine-5-)-methyltransferase n=1 Tax=Gluconacetobacter entanii TaxID=108528 RepID=A0ABT3K1A4_9PROT|nr:DNA cytosine methyltransferase [Gluconacetobacter entanii]MCW4589186.1 DNA cytosine methyltransferase [Gluconacetobacter entanii]MCW4592750.1 DNA cytosine methyltransferase [Gluconacetobacter entanii]NPC88151.1 DNA cytosine methyltransferase [Gluconacetobacter entanii]
MRLTTVDLFAGAGGLALGMELAGFKVRAAIEVDKWAAETFQVNFKESKVFTDSVSDFSDKQIAKLLTEKPLVIVGGPPCQGFSHSNIVNRDPRDPRNSLFREFLRWVSVLRPAFFLVENVAGLLATKTAEGRPVIDVIEEEIAAIGYCSDLKLLQAARFGVPQNRERLFILGAASQQLLTRFSWPRPASLEPISLWDAISDLPESGGEGYVSPPKNAYQDLMRSDHKGNAPSFHEPMRHTARIVERFKAIGFGEGEASVDVELKPKGRNGLQGKTYAQNSRRQRPDAPCSTIVASSHTNFIHPYFHRNFTVRELMRIQSFPDHFVMKGKRAVLSRSLCLKKGLLDDMHLDQRMQVGNAVPPLLAKAVAEQLRVACIGIGLRNAA